jgi:hypothetical protein
VARYTFSSTHWIEANGVPVFPVPKPGAAEYADDRAQAEEIHRLHGQHIADSLNAGACQPYPEMP